MMKKIVTGLLVLSPCLAASTYELKPGETISELLYDRLKISPIYRNRYLDKVLEYNQLTLEQAKQLKPGTLIYLPDEPVVSEPAPEPTPEPVVEAGPSVEEEPEPVTDPAITSWWKGVSLELESYTSDDHGSGLSLRPGVYAGHKWDWEKTWVSTSAELAFTKLSDDDQREGKSDFFFGGLAASAGRKFESFSAGLKVRFRQDLFLQPKGKNYQLYNPWLYSAGPVIELGSENQWQAGFFYFPDQGNGARRTKGNFEAELGYRNNRWLLSGSFGDSSTDASNSSRASLKLSYDL